MEKIMMRVYEREDFKDLSHWFWIGFNKKNTLSIVNTGYPIIPIRIIICDKSEESEAYTDLHQRNKKGKVQGTFYSDFIDGPFYVGMFVNTIEYYIDLKFLMRPNIEDGKNISYEELIEQKGSKIS